MQLIEHYDQVVKFILIGDSNVGKTSLMNRYCYNTYNSAQTTTVGLQYGQKITLINKKKVLVQLWDTAGQQKFKSLTPSYYRSAMGIILVYSVDDRQSFNSIAVWIKQIKTFTLDQIPILLVCNKADIIKKQVSQKQAISLAQAYDIDVIMASSKDNINIDQIILRLYNMVSKNRNTNDLKSSKSVHHHQILKLPPSESKSKWCFC